MDPEARTTSATIGSQSPLSAFLSNLLEDRFGSIPASGRVVVDNPVSHGLTPAMLLDSDSIPKTSASSSSSRWDHVFPSANSKNGIPSGSGNCENPCVSLPLGSLSDLPNIPVRRDSPGPLYRKQTMRAAAKSTRRIPASGGLRLLPPPKVPSTCDLFLSRSAPNLAPWTEAKAVIRPFGTKDSSGPSALFPPPFPIRQVSLSSCDLFLSVSEPNLAQTLLMHQPKLEEGAAKKKKSQQHSSSAKKKTKKRTKKSSRKSEGETKKKSSFAPQSPKSAPLLPTLSEPRSPSTPTKLYRYLRSSLSPKKKHLSLPRLPEATTRTPSPFKNSVPAPPKVRKRHAKEREAVRLIGIPESFRFPIIKDKHDDSNIKTSGAVNRGHRRPNLSRRSRRPAPKNAFSSSGSDLNDYYEMSSPRSTVVLSEGRTLVSALTSLPSPQSPTRESARARWVRNNELQGGRLSSMASHRSLSETLLSCDRDTLEPSSAPLFSTRTTNQEVCRDDKRAPPIQPIRQLSRA